MLSTSLSRLVVRFDRFRYDPTSYDIYRLVVKEGNFLSEPYLIWTIVGAIFSVSSELQVMYAIGIPFCVLPTLGYCTIMSLLHPVSLLQMPTKVSREPAKIAEVHLPLPLPFVILQLRQHLQSLFMLLPVVQV